MTTSRLCLTVLGLFVASITVECSCPDGWITRNLHCFFFSHDLEDWASAYEMCSYMGSTLVEIGDQGKGHYLSNQAQMFTGNYWIGFTDLQTEGEWQWTYSKQPLNTTGYVHWGHGEPDNLHHDQNCGFLNGTSGRWGDGHCTNLKRYICEITTGEVGVIVG